jgi:hypothetical protein
VYGGGLARYKILIGCNDSGTSWGCCTSFVHACIMLHPASLN